MQNQLRRKLSRCLGLETDGFGCLAISRWESPVPEKAPCPSCAHTQSCRQALPLYSLTFSDLNICIEMAHNMGIHW